jgi:hypothetical protein
MASASSILDIIAPQYKDDPNKADYIGFARDRTNTCVFGKNYEMAVALRAAHMMYMRDLSAAGAGGGELASKREGDLAISFHKSDTNQGDGDLSSSSFGKQLLGLMNGTIPYFGVTGGNDNGCDC